MARVVLALLACGNVMSAFSEETCSNGECLNDKTSLLQSHIAVANRHENFDEYEDHRMVLASGNKAKNVDAGAGKILFVQVNDGDLGDGVGQVKGACLSMRAGFSTDMSTDNIYYGPGPKDDQFYLEGPWNLRKFHAHLSHGAQDGRSACDGEIAYDFACLAGENVCTSKKKTDCDVPCDGNEFLMTEAGTHELSIDKDAQKATLVRKSIKRVVGKDIPKQQPQADGLLLAADSMKCPSVQHNAIAKTKEKWIIERRTPTEAEKARLMDAELCEEVETKEVGGEMASICTKSTKFKISAECAGPVEAFNRDLVAAGTPCLGPDWNNEFLNGANFINDECWKYEAYYCGNGIGHMGYSLFNCFLRNAYNLGFQGNGDGGILPQAVLSAAWGLMGELAVVTPESGQEAYPKTAKKNVYRCAFCMDFKAGDKVLVSSFLSTGQIPITSYLGTTACLYGFDNFAASSPKGANYVGEREVLLPPGLCFEVKGKEGPYSTLFNNDERFEKIQETMKQELGNGVTYAGDFMLHGIECGVDKKTYKTM